MLGKRLTHIMLAALFVFGVACSTTTLEVENTTGADIKVTITDSSKKPSKPGKKAKTKPPVVHTIANGTSKSISLTVPALNTTAKVRVDVAGDYILLNESVEVEVGKPNAKKITANAGMMEVTNNRGMDLKNLWVAEVNPKKGGSKGLAAVAKGVTGIGSDWGESRGAIKNGETLRVGPLTPSQYYRLKIALTGSTIGPGLPGASGYTVKAGEVTPVELLPTPEKK